MGKLLRLVVPGAALALLAGAPAGAAEIQVDVGDCATGVRLVARDAPLSQVLQRLSESLAFQLHEEANADSIVNVSMSAPGPELIARLAAEQRVMVSQARDPRCPGKSRVVRVWVLPKGQENVAAPREVKKAPVTLVATPEQRRQADEASKALKEAYDDYVRRNGKPPPGVEEEAARP